MKAGSCATGSCESGQALTGAALSKSPCVPQGRLVGAGCPELTWLIAHKGGLHGLFYFVKKIVMIIATGLGTGYFPVSGTVASVLAILIYLPFSRFNVLNNGLYLFYILFTLLITGLSIWTAHHAEKWLGEKDPHKVVIDEIAGYFFAMFLLPTTPLYLFTSFALFRFFDVLKPFPIRRSQNLAGGLGITIDDVLAGIYTCILIHLARLLLL